jgi:response regulator RpfG family c-di-GMP phosphodiesterase
LTKLASTDFLTGLYNFGYFQEKIGEYFQNASDQHPLALIILDVDYFKHYNDIHGHQAGDLLLSVIGDVLTEKVGPLNKEEWETLKCHSQWGSDIVKAVKKLYPIVPIILYHHENYDGTGYPTGLVGKETPILARIIRIVDSYDAMISRRPYKNQLALSTVLEELRSCAGTKFDPDLVNLFCEIILVENTSYESERK